MIGAVRAILEKRIATLRSRTFENLVYNYIGVFWLNALSLIVIPMYVRALGPLEWGLIATCMSVQIFYSVIDSGLGQVLPKWIAQYAGDQGSQGEIYALFRKYYLIAGSTIIVIGQLAAHKFSHNVAQIEGKPADLLELSFRIVVLQLALQLINSVNIGYWSGRQEQKKANLRSIIFGTIKHILAARQIENDKYRGSGPFWSLRSNFEYSRDIPTNSDAIYSRNISPNCPRA